VSGPIIEMFKATIYSIFILKIVEYSSYGLIAMKIIVAIDFSDISDKVLEIAADLAQKTQASLWLIHVVQPEPDYIGYDVGPKSERHFIAKEFQKKHVLLQDTADRLKKKKLEVTPLLIQGPTVETILLESEKLKPDMIITGSHGQGAMTHLLMGSVSKGILKKSKVPVLIVPSVD
jgi:nucleotide-binding universal stress UspA family protein